MGVPRARIPFNKYIRTFVEMMEREGWRYERVSNIRKDRFITFTANGGMDVWLFDVLLSRPVKEVRMDVPDSLLPKLLQRPNIRLS